MGQTPIAAKPSYQGESQIKPASAEGPQASNRWLQPGVVIMPKSKKYIPQNEVLAFAMETEDKKKKKKQGSSRSSMATGTLL